MKPHRLFRITTAVFLSVPTIAASAQEQQELPSLTVRIWESIGVLHPAVVHFPVAMLTVAAMFVVLNKLFKKISPDVAFYSLLIGAASTVVASVLGWSFSPYMGYGGWLKGYDPENIWSIMDAAVFNHRWLGVGLSLLACLAALLAIIARFKQNESKSLNGWWKGITLVCAALVGIVGHQGGELVYGEDFYDKAIDLALNGPPQIEAVETPPHTAGQPVDFVTQVQPIFEAACIQCHGPEKDKGDLRLHTQEAAMESDTVIVPKDAEGSDLIWLVELEPDDDDVMPPEGKAPPLTDEQKLILRDWVDQGAVWADGVVLEDKSPQTEDTNDDATKDTTEQ